MNKYYYYIIVLLIISIMKRSFFKKSTKESKLLYTGIYVDSPINIWFLKQIKKNNLSLDIKNNYLLNLKTKKRFYYKESFLLSETIADNKITTSRLMKINNVPIPNFIIFNTKKDNFKILQFKLNYYKLKYPLVLKPINGNNSTGVIIYITNFESLKKQIKILKETTFKKRQSQNVINKTEFIIEEFKYGDCYRIYMINDKIFDLYSRRQPIIIGNGKDKLDKLIKNYNNNQIKNKLNVVKNESIDLDLVKRQIDINKIIPKNKIVILINSSNTKSGGIKKVTKVSKIHKDNIELFKKIQKVSGLEINGIDFITNDISKSWKEGNSFINEINCKPGIRGHFTLNNLTDKIAKKYFDILKNESSLWK